MTFSLNGLFATLSINDTQHHNILSVVMLSVTAPFWQIEDIDGSNPSERFIPIENPIKHFGIDFLTLTCKLQSFVISML